MKSTSFLQKHKKIGFKRPVQVIHFDESSDQETEDEKENVDLDSTSISSPEEMQLPSPIQHSISNKIQQKHIRFELPINLEKEKTIPEPSSDLFDNSFDWITENEFKQDTDCDDLFFSQIDYPFL